MINKMQATILGTPVVQRKNPSVSKRSKASSVIRSAAADAYAMSGLNPLEK